MSVRMKNIGYELSEFFSNYGSLNYWQVIHGAKTLENVLSDEPEVFLDNFPHFLYDMVPFGSNVGREPAFVTGVMENIYSLLERDCREKGLKRMLSYFDNIGEKETRELLSKVEEPLFASDLYINRYILNRSEWIPYREYSSWFEGEVSWESFKDKCPNCKSRFWLTLAMLNVDYSPEGLRKSYINEFGDTVENCLEGLAGMLYEEVSIVSELYNSSFNDVFKERINQFDKSIRDGLLKKGGEGKWIRLRDNEGSECELNLC